MVEIDSYSQERDGRKKHPRVLVVFVSQYLALSTSLTLTGGIKARGPFITTSSSCRAEEDHHPGAADQPGELGPCESSAVDLTSSRLLLRTAGSGATESKTLPPPGDTARLARSQRDKKEFTDREREREKKKKKRKRGRNV